MSVDFGVRTQSVCPESLRFDRLLTLQVNLGNLCNQMCKHCHIKAGPLGKRIMRHEVMGKVIEFLGHNNVSTLDVTGGCPEMNPNFRFFIEQTRRFVPRLTVRTNLTILLEYGYDWIPKWYGENGIVIIASMPCYTRKNVDAQRGNGIFDKSIKALRKLNDLGYGDSLELNLVYNPGGPLLPAPQSELEMEYKRQLYQNYGIRFNNLFTITNAPLGRFREILESSSEVEQYLNLLENNFNPSTLEHVMCRTLINVDWEGNLYDCDFNQVAGLPIINQGGWPLSIDDIQDAIQSGRQITVAEHCYCCTAGAGSSCRGVLA